MTYSLYGNYSPYKNYSIYRLYSNYPPPPLPKNNNDIGCYVPVAADVVMN